MTRVSKTHFGGATKAVDGVIATLTLNGEIIVKHFAQVIHTRTPSGGKRVATPSPPERPNQQLIDYCDRTGAKVISMSTPETILRDLQGTRAELEARANQKHPQEHVPRPETSMLAGRNDLLIKP